MCKPCTRSYRSSSRERINKWSRNWAKNHPEQVKERARQYRLKYHDKILEKSRTNNLKHYWSNPEKARAYAKAWSIANPLSRLRRNWKRKYGLTEAAYFAMLEKQGGKCACCGLDPATKATFLCVDHCHLSGKVRGLLCSQCNWGVGHMRDSVGVALEITAYLLRNGSVESYLEIAPHISAKAQWLLDTLRTMSVTADAAQQPSTQPA